MIFACDTETTGPDFHHIARPYFVTTCDVDGRQEFWQWDVDPLTRKPIIPAGHVEEIQYKIEQAEAVVFQNPKFDISALNTIKIKVPWHKVHDTLAASHVLASAEPHGLDDLARDYLGINIRPYEDACQAAATEARRLAKRYYPDWKIAAPGRDMPSVKKTSKRNEDKPWKNDMWLPREIARIEQYPASHEWWSVLQEYSNTDSAVTIELWKVFEEFLRRRNLWEIYLTRLKVLAAAWRMENWGVSNSRARTAEVKVRYADTSAKCRARCIELSGGTLDELPVNGRSNALDAVVFGKFELVSTKATKKGNDSMDKDVLEGWLATTDKESDAHQFILNLQYYRKRQTALGYIDSYERFRLSDERDPSWDTCTLYPTYNVTGTRLLRGSMSNPNGQQISKQHLKEMGSQEKGKNVRWMFGPRPGREWWSMDGQNLELRIPAYEAGEAELMWVFDRPNEAPFYGSYHLLICDVLYPELFKIWGAGFKDEFKDTLYQWVKNGNFAMQYGCQEAKADATFHFPGAYRLIGQRFPKVRELADRMKALASRNGIVHTIPDLTVSPDQGYPLMVKMSEYGGVVPTTPLSYHVQGTAGWWINKAMIRCDEQLYSPEWCVGGWQGAICLQVHDELVFDLPRGKGREPWKTNLPRVKKLKALMELGGRDISVPTPVSVEYHPVSWADGMAV